MRRFILTALSLLALMTGVCSCEHAFPDDRLDYYWRLDRIEYRDGVDFRGETCQYKDVDNIMFGFARHIVKIEAPWLTVQHGVTTEFEDSIRLDYSMYYDHGVTGQLQDCGLEGMVSTFKLEFPNKSSMVLSGCKTILHFRKW